ncbi:blast:RING finger protein 17 [Drosophila guanche]|uniref:Blast:RING finger protein 17 n=2 Tax=Drosophila guanche TaxID=7266 RepID=A0A3B0JSE6_DROGU|nr:blast:RING finger protein 17 [Drosophila guanche]
MALLPSTVTYLQLFVAAHYIDVIKLLLHFVYNKYRKTMDLKDFLAVKQLCDNNVEKLKNKLANFKRDLDILCRVLDERWVNVEKEDRALIGMHDLLLGSMSSFNENVIKWNMHLNLNKLGLLVANNDEHLRRNDILTHTNKHGIEVGNVLDERPHGRQTIQHVKDNRSAPLVQNVESSLSRSKPVSDTLSLSTRSSWLTLPPVAHVDDTATVSATKSMLPISPRKQRLEPPSGGTRISSSEIYNQIVKNVAAFPEGNVINAAVMHLNIEENCFFVGKWDAKPLQRLLEGNLLLKELDQLPNFGEIFAVYDCLEQIIPRVTINDYADGGGYDAYLIDYGEHIHLNGDENIFSLPDDIRQLPAEAIKCFFREGDVSSMTKTKFKSVNLRVLKNRINDLIVELAEENKSESTQKKIPDVSEGPQLSEADLAMLNEIDEGTSDPLMAVLGFRPTDEQRICRHYDPELNGCFKGGSCRLAHEPLAPHGATKDVEVAAALPEAVFDTPLSRELGSTVKMLITYVSSTTEMYGQFVDGSSPLVWTKNDVLGANRQFKQKPHMLDIVLARYSDGCYYRAQVIEESDGDYKIFYVDYGNTEFVPLNDLVPCGEVDCLRPHRAVSCHIEGVEYRNSLSPKEATECMEYLKSKILNVEEDVLLVRRLHDSFEIRFLGVNANLPEQLMKRGYSVIDDDGTEKYDSKLDLIKD